MPGPKKKPKDVKHYTEGYATEGQRITGDGSQVVMNNGRRFKRVVLPSVAEVKTQHIKEEIQMEQAFEELDQMRTQEQEPE